MHYFLDLQKLYTYRYSHSACWHWAWPFPILWLWLIKAQALTHDWTVWRTIIQYKILPVFCSMCVRSRSPLDTCTSPKSFTILLEIVPLPEPGGPIINARRTLQTIFAKNYGEVKSKSIDQWNLVLGWHFGFSQSTHKTIVNLSLHLYKKLN